MFLLDADPRLVPLQADGFSVGPVASPLAPLGVDPQHDFNKFISSIALILLTLLYFTSLKTKKNIKFKPSFKNPFEPFPYLYVKSYS